MLEKTYIVPMDKNDLINKVNAIKPGSMHYVEWLDGAPIEIGDTTVYVTNKMLVRFKINYGRLPATVFKRSVMRSVNAEDIKLVEQYFNTMKPHRKACVGNKWLKLFDAKKEALAEGKTLSFVEMKDKDGKITSSSTYAIEGGVKTLLATEPVIIREHDPDCPCLTICANGSITLTVYTTFAHKITWHDGKRSVAPRLPEKHYYAVTGDKIVELVASSGSEAEALKKLIDESRTRAEKKRSSTPTEVMTPNIKNIISIDGKKK